MIVGVFLDSKILLLGGSGTLGSCIIKSKFFKNIDNPSKKKLNILNKKKLFRAIKGSEIVFNFAALANMNELNDKAEKTVKYNILGTVNALNVCNKCKVKKFIHASTIYANTEEGGFYGRSKKAAEHYVEEYFNFYKLKYTILRFGSLYGERAEKDNGIRQILENIKKKKSVIYPDKIEKEIVPIQSFNPDERIKCGGCNESFGLSSNELKIHCNLCCQFFHCKIAGKCDGENCKINARKKLEQGKIKRFK